MNKKAQGITEYALMIAVVAAALLAMQPYFKRGAQAVVKTAVDDIGGFGGGEISPEKIQAMADDQELDPKYGMLQSYKTQVTTDHSVTVTTPADSNGEKKTAIASWSDSVHDVEKDGVRGKVFYQELNN